MMPLLGARFCHDRLIDNPCSFPAEKPHLACLMPDLLRVSTGSALPRSAECHLSVSFPARGTARVDEFTMQGTSSRGFMDASVLYNNSGHLGAAAVVSGPRWWKCRAGAVAGLLPSPLLPTTVTATSPHSPAQGSCHPPHCPQSSPVPVRASLVHLQLLCLNSSPWLAPGTL